jgi:O-antigen/teichoic acid export membrane protein
LFSNILWSTSGALVNALAGLVTLPFLVSRLGTESYGLWTLIVAVSGYIMALELGVTTALGRLIAGYRAEDEIGKINIALSTAMVLLLGTFLLACIATWVGVGIFFAAFEIPQERSSDVLHALLLSAFFAAAAIPASIGGAILWGYERFDLIHLLDNPIVILRTALTLWLIDTNSTLVELVLIVVTTSGAGFLLRAALCLWVEPRLSLRAQYFSQREVRSIFAFGFWYSVLSTTKTVLPQIAPLIVGGTLGNSAVTHYAVPRQLVTYSNWLIVAANQAAIPRATLLFFADRKSEQEQLFILGGKLSLGLALYLLGGFVLFSTSFLSLWQPTIAGDVYYLLLILMLGEVLPMAQWTTHSVILGLGQHRLLAVLGVAEGLFLAALCLVIVPRFGLVGVGITVAVVGFTFRGLFQMLYGCNLLGISPASYAHAVILPLVPVMLTIALAFWAVAAVPQPTTWFGLILAGAFYSACFLAVVMPLVFGWRKVGEILGRALKGNPTDVSRHVP